MRSRRHILLLVPGFPGNESDSTCIPALQAIVRELRRQGGEDLLFSVVTFQYPFDAGDYTWHSVPVWSAGGKNRSLPRKLFTWFRVLRKVFQIHRKNRIDVVHSFWLHECTFLGRWIAKFTGAKHLAMVMGQDVLPGNGYMKFSSLKYVTVIANSPFSADLLEKNYGIKTNAVIPIGIRPEDFDGINIHTDRTVDLLNVGSLIPLKNQRLFIELFVQLKQRFPHITGAIVGSGILEKELSDMIADSGLSESLKLYPGLPREEVLNIMARSKILVHTSAYESAGYVLLEGLYSGMKVVSFQTGYMPESENAYDCSLEKDMSEILEKLLSVPFIKSQPEIPLISETAKNIIAKY